MNEKKWNGRVLTSLCALAGFILLAVSSVILYIQPHGRVAYWTEWSFLGLEKDQWGQIHIFAGLVFLVASFFHLWFNWTPLVKYLSARVNDTLRHKRELLVSAVIMVWIVVSGVFSLPPLSLVVDGGESIKNSWVTSPDLEPPFGHAELVSLKAFCLKQRIPLDQAMVELRKAGFRVDSPKNTLAEISKTKGLAAVGLYEVIKSLEPKPEAMKPDQGWSAEKIEETFAGTGLGRKTLDQVIKELNLDPEEVRQRLEKAGLKVDEGARFKDLADENQTTPIKLLTVILVEKE